MILLLGGTSETAACASALLAAGIPVLVSTATDEPLALPEDSRLRRQVGRLDIAGLTDLLRTESIRAVVDATHPFADAVHANARAAAANVGVPYIRYERPVTDSVPDEALLASDHDEAATLAAGLMNPVLLTVGSNHVERYAAPIHDAGLVCIARVLPREESIAACHAAGLTDDCIVAARGPFTTEDTAQLIRAHSIGTLVTKDSGAAGGLIEKVEAAQETGCRLVVVRRPVMDPNALTSPDALAKRVLDSLRQ